MTEEIIGVSQLLGTRARAVPPKCMPMAICHNYFSLTFKKQHLQIPQLTFASMKWLAPRKIIILMHKIISLFRLFIYQERVSRWKTISTLS